MSAERWLQFKSPKEAARAKSFLAPLGENLFVNKNKTGCWIDFTGKRKLEILYSGSGHSNSELAYYICREVAKRFECTRLGADSVGWFPDKEWQITPEEYPRCCQVSYGLYPSWIAWVKEYNLEWAYGRPHLTKFHLAEISQIETDVVAAFQKLDSAQTPTEKTKETVKEVS